MLPKQRQEGASTASCAAKWLPGGSKIRSPGPLIRAAEERRGRRGRERRGSPSHLGSQVSPLPRPLSQMWRGGGPGGSCAAWGVRTRSCPVSSEPCLSACSAEDRSPEAAGAVGGPRPVLSAEMQKHEARPRGSCQDLRACVKLQARSPSPAQLPVPQPRMEPLPVKRPGHCHVAPGTSTKSPEPQGPLGLSSGHCPNPRQGAGSGGTLRDHRVSF